MARETSETLFEHAQRVMPGGVNSPVRAFRGVGGTPVFVRSARGAWIEDEDGNRYVDYVGSWGPMILGHARAEVVEAVREAALRGTSYGAPTRLENEFADLILELVPSVEMVRLVSSGTEATLSAIRVARGYTGRPKILKFTGCYHGHGDSLLVSGGSGIATLSLPGTPGVLPETAANTIAVPYNDFTALDAAFERYGHELAGVIVEPVAGNMGCVLPVEGWLARLRSLCDASGALLIFDEVMTGFRVALGGAQARFGVRPDLTTLGKIIGGGLPVGAYGGRREIMERVAPAGDIYQAGTLSGNPLAVSAGLAQLRILRDTPGLYDDLEARTRRIAEGILDAGRRHGHALVGAQAGAMFGFYFSSTPVLSYEDAQRSDVARFGRWFHAMLDRGVYWAPSAFEAAFVSTAHGEEEIARTLVAADEAFEAVAGA